jgi:hypothetical protein
MDIFKAVVQILPFIKIFLNRGVPEKYISTYQKAAQSIDKMIDSLEILYNKANEIPDKPELKKLHIDNLKTGVVTVKVMLETFQANLQNIENKIKEEES